MEWPWSVRETYKLFLTNIWQKVPKGCHILLHVSSCNPSPYKLLYLTSGLTDFSPFKWYRVLQSSCHIIRTGFSEVSHGDKASAVKCPGPLRIQQRHSDQVAELPVNPKSEAALELREQQLHVVPAQSITENCYHSWNTKVTLMSELQLQFY